MRNGTTARWLVPAVLFAAAALTVPPALVSASSIDGNDDLVFLPDADGAHVYGVPKANIRFGESNPAFVYGP
ncbi:MAG TPA: hypothetical protein VFZ32_09000 [Micromonosporaceae bacterium]